MLQIKSTDSISIKQIPNTDGYDGHSLRAFGYFPDEINIEQASEDEQCLLVNNVLIKESDDIKLDGQKYTFAELKHYLETNHAN